MSDTQSRHAGLRDVLQLHDVAAGGLLGGSWRPHLKSVLGD